MKASRVCLFVFLITIPLCLVNTQHVKPQSSGTIYIRSDGTVEGTDKIQRDGDVYTFTDNISGSIVVERSDILLDGAGYRLQGDGNENGITLGDTDNNTVKNLKLTNFNIGIVVMDSENNKILENTITDNFRGLDLTASENNTVSGNYIANNTDGIALENMYNSIFGNIITNNSNSGIFLNGAGYNNIIGNNITNNGRGISVSICDNNVIYHNNFVNNTNHVETDYSIGIWNDGEEGNYWDNHTGIDNYDGIGDTPYIINAYNRDNYPLMKPMHACTIPPPPASPCIIIVFPENKTYDVNNVTLVFSVSESTSWIGYSLDGQDTVTITRNMTIIWAAPLSHTLRTQVSLSGLSDGPHSLVVYAMDEAGNTGTSETIHFSIAQQSVVSDWFFPTLIVAAIVIIAVVGVALLVYFTKVKKTTEKAE